jgi:hypothetical protein
MVWWCYIGCRLLVLLLWVSLLHVSPSWPPSHVLPLLAHDIAPLFLHLLVSTDGNYLCRQGVFEWWLSVSGVLHLIHSDEIQGLWICFRFCRHINRFYVCHVPTATTTTKLFSSKQVGVVTSIDSMYVMFQVCLFTYQNLCMSLHQIQVPDKKESLEYCFEFLRQVFAI